MIATYTDRITVQARTLTNAGGTPVETFAAVSGLSRIAASVTQPGATRIERVFGSQLQGEMSHVVRVPAPSDDVALTGRVVWHSRHGDRTLAIVGKALTQDARVRELVLACAEVRTT